MPAQISRCFQHRSKAAEMPAPVSAHQAIRSAHRLPPGSNAGSMRSGAILSRVSTFASTGLALGNVFLAPPNAYRALVSGPVRSSASGLNRPNAPTRALKRRAAECAGPAKRVACRIPLSKHAMTRGNGGKRQRAKTPVPAKRVPASAHPEAPGAHQKRRPRRATNKVNFSNRPRASSRASTAAAEANALQARAVATPETARPSSVVPPAFGKLRPHASSCARAAEVVVANALQVAAAAARYRVFPSCAAAQALGRTKQLASSCAKAMVPAVASVLLGVAAAASPVCPSCVASRGCGRIRTTACKDKSATPATACSPSHQQRLPRRRAQHR